MAKIVKVINVFSEASATTTSTTAVVASTNETTGNYWDTDTYDGNIEVYFEAVFKSSTSSGSAYVRLHNTSSTYVTGSEVSTTSTTTTVVRSGDIKANLVDNTGYVTFIKADSGVTTTLYAARLIIIQTGGITKTETQIPLAGQAVATLSTSVIDHTFTYLYYHDANKFDGAVSFYFEAGCRATSGGVTATAYLYDTSNNLVTSVSVTGTTAARVRSSAITLTDGTSYKVRMRTSNGFQYAQINSCKLIVQQTGFTKTETHYPLRTTQLTANSTSDTSLDGLITWDNSEWFTAVNTIYYETTLMITGANTAYLDLNDGSSDVVTLSTTSTTKTRVRSSAPAIMPDDTYDAQLRASASVTATAVGARLIIHSQLQNAPFYGSEF